MGKNRSAVSRTTLEPMRVDGEFGWDILLPYGVRIAFESGLVTWPTDLGTPVVREGELYPADGVYHFPRWWRNSGRRVCQTLALLCEPSYCLGYLGEFGIDGAAAQP